jgi:molybdopterin/thiamine biosynthesis adenylyltransferase/rhodanese-related sulfurtransferase
MNPSPENNETSSLPLSEEERLRYSRHLMMPEVTMKGQQRLKAARVLCIGAGGLGSPALLYLAAAGVGTLGLVDFDKVDHSNLQRQILHGTGDVGRRKTESARARLAEANPNVALEIHDCRFTSENAQDLVARYDIMVDGSDNFATRYLSNDVCVWAHKPNVYGSVFRFDGHSSVFAPHLGGPCYRCLFPEPPEPGSVPNCAEAGVFGVLPGIIGMVQAIETIKLIIGIGEPLVGRLLSFDALRMKFRDFNLRRDPACPVCGDAPTIFEPIDYEGFCNARPESESSVPTISVSELKQKIDAAAAMLILDVREPFEYEIARIDGSTLIPLDQLSDRLGELDRDRQIVAVCKSGARSAYAVQLLQRSGFAHSFNLEGGVEAWADQIDPTMPKY